MMPPDPLLQGDEEEICDEEWLGHMRLYGKQGFFRHEPDFPQALREFEEAITEAKRDPHYLPPPEFMPHVSEVRRRRYWRGNKMGFGVANSWLWLLAMYDRVINGIPAVTLREWDMLTAWYQRHRHAISLKRVDKELSLPALDQELQRTHGRHLNAGKYAMVLRQLYAHFHRTGLHAALPPSSEAGSNGAS